MVNATYKCPVCRADATESNAGGASSAFSCPFCGDFKISGTLLATLPTNSKYNDKDRALIGYVLRQKQQAGETPELVGNIVERIVAENSLPEIKEQIDNLIYYLGELTTPGRQYRGDTREVLTTIGAIDLENYMLIRHFLFEKEYASGVSGIGDYKEDITLRIQGWERFYELKNSVSDNRLAFMAMPFEDKRLQNVFLNWFKPACQALGFELRRVDELPEAGIINNKMMVDIRKSRFIIAELTGENRGVYWEAGFAEGLKKPVIYTCDDEYEANNPLHFDIRQHHTVFWTDDTLKEAAENLVVTIQATIPEAKTIDVREIQWP